MYTADIAVIQTYSIPRLPQFVEGFYIEPRALVSLHIQRHPHSILLQQSREPLVHCQVFVTLKMQQL